MSTKLGDMSVGSSVYFNVDSVRTEFIIIHQGLPNSEYDTSCNGTWVLAKNVYGSSQEFDSQYTKYSTSDIRLYVNTTFRNLIESDIRVAIKQVKIPYVNGEGYETVDASWGADGYSTYVFLLAGAEVGYKTSRMHEDGAALSYFSDTASSSGDDKRIAYRDTGTKSKWWLRTPSNYTVGEVYYCTTTGDVDGQLHDSTAYVRPAMVFDPDTMYVLDDGTLTSNQPPTAPGSIDVSGVVAGEATTITLTAATDNDGTISSYIYERSIDGGEWAQINNANSLIYTDTVGDEWATVAYRAKAVDDMGATGSYSTSATFGVNDGWIYISGPESSNLTEKTAPFTFRVSVGATPVGATTDIATEIALDGKVIYSNVVAADEVISLQIDTRLLSAGEHTIEVTASKTDYLTANNKYTFTIPSIELPDGGIAELLQNQRGKAIFPITLARLVLGEDGKDVNALLDEIRGEIRFTTGTYVGTGTYDSGNPNTLEFEFTPQVVLVFADGEISLGETTGFIWLGGQASGEKVISLSGTTFSWYSATSPANQMNTSASTYRYFALGSKEVFE